MIWGREKVENDESKNKRLTLSDYKIEDPNVISASIDTLTTGLDISFYSYTYFK